MILKAPHAETVPNCGRVARRQLSERGLMQEGRSMQFVKWSVLSLAAAVFLVLGTRAMAADATNAVSGKASCGHCSGVVSGKCCVLLTDSNGDRWVLKGQNDILQAAMAERKGGKTMTATIIGKPVTKKGKDGKDYKEVKVSAVKIES